MGDFAITVNNRRYTIACSEESEGRLAQAASQLDARVKPLAERYGNVGDDRLLMLAALQIIDELMTTREKLDEINALIEKSSELTALMTPDYDEATDPEADQADDQSRKDEEAEADEVGADMPAEPLTLEESDAVVGNEKDQKTDTV